jgi:AcrR family transcriptional regulator
MDQSSGKSQPVAQRGRPGRPPKVEGDLDLRDRILDVAEAQFASRGYEAVSTREVARLVGATPAMIHYYFNSKRQLFDAVFARRADILNVERMAKLDGYEATAGDAVTVEGAIAAFLRPVMEKLKSGDPGWRSYLALVAQVAQVTEWGGAVMTQSFDPVIQRLMAVVRRALPKATEEDLYWAYHFLSGALVLTLAETDRIDRLSGGRCRSVDIEAIEPRLVRFAASGFRDLARG